MHWFCFISFINLITLIERIFIQSVRNMGKLSRKHDGLGIKNFHGISGSLTKNEVVMLLYNYPSVNKVFNLKNLLLLDIFITILVNFKMLSNNKYFRVC